MFTFKRQKASTGLAAVGDPYAAVDIKIKKRICGHISPPNWMSKGHTWKVRFAVKDETQKCGWKWVTLKYDAVDEQTAREFLVKNYQAIIDRCDLHFFED